MAEKINFRTPWSELYYRVQDARIARLHCYYCKVQLTRETATRDHVVPKAKGGPDHPWNVVPSCKRCNWQKGDMDYDDFMQQMGFA